jgi:hypothetical protein
MDTLLKFDLPNGHELYVTPDYERGVVKAPFACSRAIIYDKGDTFEYEIDTVIELRGDDATIRGLMSIEEALKYLRGLE